MTDSIRSLISDLQYHSSHAPDSVALVDGDESISYEQLWVLVSSVRASLTANGVSHGDRVAIVATKTINAVSLILGAMSADAVAVLINPLLKPLQLTSILNDCQASMLFGPGSYLAQIKTIHRVCPSIKLTIAIDPNNNDDHGGSSWQTFLQHARENDEVVSEVNIQAPAAILYTSGSTGSPKGVVLTHANLAFGAASVSGYLDNHAKDRILALMPLSFDYGLSQLTTALHVGACLVLFDFYLPRGVLNAVVRHKITGLPAVPHVWDQLANLAWPEVSHLRYLTNTGGRMNECTSIQLTRLLPNVKLYLMYGFTEAFRSTYLPPDQVLVRPRSVGKAVPYASVKIVDKAGNEVPAETIGELIHGGPLVAAGYWNDDDLTRGKFRPRYRNSAKGAELFAWSGDLARRDDEGYIYFVSRRDEQIKLRGFRVNPQEIEEVICTHPDVLEACVICVPHPRQEIAVIAIVVACKSEVCEDVESYCKTHLPGYMAPEMVVQTAQLPVTPNNKVDRKTLATTYHSFFTSAHARYSQQ